MATINSFEDLEVWKKARTLAREIFEITLRGNLRKDFSLKEAINKTTGSIMDNIAEGFDRGGNKEFIQFLFIAKGSAAELRSQLYRALDRNHLEQGEFESLKVQVETISKQLSALITYLKCSDLKGPKYVNEPLENYGNLK
ncbi:MAG: four helix bundle protein [Flammeovirgaceae bacterium]|nr:MAG: four helix bundle protein [Flammeovirgaceae bacterium]